jgi:hypothetical protein
MAPLQLPCPNIARLGFVSRPRRGGATWSKQGAGGRGGRGSSSLDFNLDDLLHPAQAFEHPRHVVEDPDLTLNEKRAILASWASDACAMEAAPALRQAPGTTHPVRFDDVMEALRMLDHQARNHHSMPPRYRRILENRIPGVFGRRSRHQRTSSREQPIN